MTYIDDSTRLQVLTIANPSLADQIDRAVREEYNKLLCAIPRPILDSADSCSAEQALPYLTQCRKWLEQRLLKEAQELSSLQWLWFLRRTSSFMFFGSRTSTQRRGHMLAESLTARGGSDSGMTPRTADGWITYRVDRLTVTTVLQFCAGVSVLNEFHILLRYSGKGCNFRFSPNHGIPEKVCTTEIQEAVDLYDSRAATGVDLFSPIGTDPFTQWDVLTPNTILLLANLDHPEEMPALFSGSHYNYRPLSVFSYYRVGFTSVDGLAALANALGITVANWLSIEFGALLILLLSTYDLMRENNGGTVSLQQFGYVMMKTSQVEYVLAQHFARAVVAIKATFQHIPLPRDTGELLKILRQKPKKFWPFMPSSVVRRSGDVLSIDFRSATYRLSYLLQYPTSGDTIVNIRTKHFEDTMQSIIDVSPWRPSDDLRKFRNKHLQHRGETFTEIDALGAIGDTLLIVSCKSIVYTSLYDAGQFEAVRSAQKLVEREIIKLNRNREIIMNNPKGNNYDFSA